VTKKVTKTPTPTEPSPSGKWLAELEALRHLEDEQQRSPRVWQIVVEASAHEDFSVLLDYSLEHGLVLPCDAATKTWTNPIDRSEMVWIPPGPFVVGEDERPAECAGFSLARHPVTNAQFKRFRVETQYYPDSTLDMNPAYFLAHWAGSGGRVPNLLERHPVVWVSYIDALAYCRWAGLTLPTEWLWEKAARGSEGRLYPWGNQPPVGFDKPLARIGTNSTCPIGSFPRTRTPYGCEDMIGNVSEWCMPLNQDYGTMPSGWPSVPAGAAFATVRGSCFLRSNSKRMRACHRRQLSVTRRNQWVGFRPACYLPCRPA
jgi:formylglycine-generating enzyme required for sulfatase activity